MVTRRGSFPECPARAVEQVSRCAARQTAMWIPMAEIGSGVACRLLPVSSETLVPE